MLYQSDLIGTLWHAMAVARRPPPACSLRAGIAGKRNPHTYRHHHCTGSDLAVLTLLSCDGLLGVSTAVLSWVAICGTRDSPCRIRPQSKNSRTHSGQNFNIYNRHATRALGKKKRLISCSRSALSPECVRRAGDERSEESHRVVRPVLVARHQGRLK